MRLPNPDGGPRRIYYFKSLVIIQRNAEVSINEVLYEGSNYIIAMIQFLLLKVIIYFYNTYS